MLLVFLFQVSPCRIAFLTLAAVPENYLLPIRAWKPVFFTSLYNMYVYIYYFSDVCVMRTLHRSVALGWRVTFNDISVAESFRYRLTFFVCRYTPNILVSRSGILLFFLRFRYKHKRSQSNDNNKQLLIL
jgi:hypothetical protein